MRLVGIDEKKSNQNNFTHQFTSFISTFNANCRNLSKCPGNGDYLCGKKGWRNVPSSISNWMNIFQPMRISWRFGAHWIIKLNRCFVLCMWWNSVLFHQHVVDYQQICLIRQFHTELLWFSLTKLEETKKITILMKNKWMQKNFKRDEQLYVFDCLFLTSSSNVWSQWSICIVSHIVCVKVTNGFFCWIHVMNNESNSNFNYYITCSLKWFLLLVVKVYSRRFESLCTTFNGRLLTLYYIYWDNNLRWFISYLKTRFWELHFVVLNMSCDLLNDHFQPLNEKNHLASILTRRLRCKGRQSGKISWSSVEKRCWTTVIGGKLDGKNGWKTN